MTNDLATRAAFRAELIKKGEELQAERAAFRKLLDKMNAVLATNDDAAWERFIAKYPGMVNYDEKGNWIGSVRHENGWTA